MNHLLREIAPIPAVAWQQIDDEAKDRLSVPLGARRIVDFHGPLGWTHSSMNLGRTGSSVSAGEHVTARQREVLALAELRAPFALAIEELIDATRGAQDVDYTTLDDAARAIAMAENAAIIDGFGEFGIVGIAEASPHEAISVEADPSGLALAVAEGVERLKAAGVGGPYAFAVGDERWAQIAGGNDLGGERLRQHLERVLDGKVVYAPGIASSVVVSLRGGDYRLEIGEDLSIGYRSSDADQVNLYFEETLAFHVDTPEAGIVIS